MIQRKKNLSGIEIDDVFEPVLVLAAFLRDQTSVEQLFVWSRKVRDVDLDMMSVEFRNLFRRLPENKLLAVTHLNMRREAVRFSECCGCGHDFAVEPRNTGSGISRHVEFDIRNTQRHAPKPFAR